MDQLEVEPRAPTSTYRLQLQPAFGFAQAGAIAGYLRDLGVGAAYCSPYLQAVAGSQHGYDVVDHTHVSADLGGAAGHAEFCRDLREAGLGQILDIVPNHMSITSADNEWWWDVLRLGRDSEFATYFDVDWNPAEQRLRGKILLPVLGDHYGRVLARGEVTVHPVDGDLEVHYFEQRFPVRPGSWDGGAVEVAAACRDLDRLHQLLEAQHYRLAWWRTAGRDLGYRRFFDIVGLAALRMEEEVVFLNTHALVLRWLAVGVLDGVRVDHPDGLRDPRGYFARLREAAPWSWIVAEKVVLPGEVPPADWPVEGTTGYEFLNLVNGLFVDANGEPEMTRIHAEMTGQRDSFADIAHEARLHVTDVLLASDVMRLVNRMLEICEQHREHRDHTRHTIADSLTELLASFPVYRTYVGDGEAARSVDVEVIQSALAAAVERRPDLDFDLMRFIGAILTGATDGVLERGFRARFQQTTGPVMAKGVEDTAFYRYSRLISLNEVGSDPARFGTAPEEFHRDAGWRADHAPTAMLTSGTHDTKRSEDVRARVNLLSEIPGEWAAAAARWSDLGRRHRRGIAPDPELEYLLLQTFFGAWPLAAERATRYAEKAAKEAKRQTSWLEPNPAFDADLGAWVRGCLGDAEFAGAVDEFTRPLIQAGWKNSLAIKLITLMAPGIPDVYQGSELWDLALVDPDNRRPVDYAARAQLLAEVAAVDDPMTGSRAWGRAEEGLPKMVVVNRALRLRRDRPDIARMPYRPLSVEGAAAEHLVAFARGDGAIVLAPRLVLELERRGGWSDTLVRLPPGQWWDAFNLRLVDGGSRPVADLLADFPVGLLVSQVSGSNG